MPRKLPEEIQKRRQQAAVIDLPPQHLPFTVQNKILEDLDAVPSMLSRSEKELLFLMQNAKDPLTVSWIHHLYENYRFSFQMSYYYDEAEHPIGPIVRVRKKWRQKFKQHGKHGIEIKMKELYDDIAKVFAPPSVPSYKKISTTLGSLALLGIVEQRPAKRKHKAPWYIAPKFRERWSKNRLEMKERYEKNPAQFNTEYDKELLKFYLVGIAWEKLTPFEQYCYDRVALNWHFPSQIQH